MKRSQVHRRQGPNVTKMEIEIFGEGTVGHGFPGLGGADFGGEKLAGMDCEALDERMKWSLRRGWAYMHVTGRCRNGKRAGEVDR